MVNSFAPLECSAVRLREARFALANQIRFTEDSLMRDAGKVDTTRLQKKLHALYLEKEVMGNKSVHLADSIKHTLDSLMLHHLTDKKEREAFNEMLNEALEKMGCKDKE